MTNNELLTAVKDGYNLMQEMGGDYAGGFDRAVEPPLHGVPEEERKALGQTLWGEFYEHHATNPGEVYRYTGLAAHLDPTEVQV